jgi:hypothetical protein
MGSCGLHVRAAFAPGVTRSVPRVIVPFEDEAEEKDVFPGRPRLDPRKASPRDAPPGQIRCWDPCTMQDLGTVKAYTAEEVCAAVQLGKAAQAKWQASSFAQVRPSCLPS